MSRQTLQWVLGGLLAFAIVLGLGVDIGLRLADRTDSGVGSPPPATSQARRALPKADRVYVPHQDPFAAADAEAELGAPPLVDPEVEQAERLQDQWEKPVAFESRVDEGPMPAMSEEVASLISSADEAVSAGEMDEAIESLQKAEASTRDSRRKEEIKSRRLWLVMDQGDVQAAREIAHDLGENAVRLETRQMAAEVLVKLDSK
jgi:hypothetical protein